MLDEAVEVVDGEPDAPVVVTCEHASERMPEPWSWPRGDLWLVGTHWAYDLGAADLARSVAGALGAPVVLSRFSRLLADPNRPEDSPELFRDVAEGRPIKLNTALGDAERAGRLDRLYRPYHAAVDRVVAACSAPLVLAVHSFTPVYEERIRELEVGVLFDHEEELAMHVRDALDAAGFAVQLNEPYSGKGGMMYSADRHAARYGRQALEIELRQDLACEEAARGQVAAALVRCLQR